LGFWRSVSTFVLSGEIVPRIPGCETPSRNPKWLVPAQRAWQVGAFIGKQNFDQRRTSRVVELQDRLLNPVKVVQHVGAVVRLDHYQCVGWISRAADQPVPGSERSIARIAQGLGTIRDNPRERLDP